MVMEVVYNFYGNRSTFEYEFENEYEYVVVCMDIMYDGTVTRPWVFGQIFVRTNLRPDKSLSIENF